MENNTQYMADIQSAFAERTVKRLTVLSGILAVALIVNAVLLRKR